MPAIILHRLSKLEISSCPSSLPGYWQCSLAPAAYDRVAGSVGVVVKDGGRGLKKKWWCPACEILQLTNPTSPQQPAMADTPQRCDASPHWYTEVR